VIFSYSYQEQASRSLKTSADGFEPPGYMFPVGLAPLLASITCQNCCPSEGHIRGV